MVIAAIAFHWIPISKDLVLQADAVNWAGIVVLVTIIFYVAFFATGVATIGWVGTELLPLEIRALGTMMNTLTCWSCNLIIASTFLSMMKSMTPSGAFGFYAGICFFGWILVLFFYPEVKGLPLEEVRKVFENGFDVKLAKQMQRDLKANSPASVASKAYGEILPVAWHGTVEMILLRMFSIYLVGYVTLRVQYNLLKTMFPTNNATTSVFGFYQHPCKPKK
ncbi:hypothetical protein FNYG_06845 [Fusarium nygamai]|uniref:Major facilitator superfamily (MFS) profile domain-containing protein n=1 Tax=Gibberella nygamai TaxID=42673 RepID=A0A2K0WBU0_GIBNY|nr:hypothetical protein FNYG_06845 [Fusarium nygamai]